MNLADLRRVTVKKHLRIRFTLSNGMECVVNEHGVAQVPALRAVPSFNLEGELAQAGQFLLDPVPEGPKDRDAMRPRRCTRDELSAMAGAGNSAVAAHDEHED